ncbi:MAG: type III polyketide synthase [Hyphomicrobiales bacterium]
MTDAYLNGIATAVPPHDVNTAFLNFAKSKLNGHAPVFDRMAQKSGIEHRYSFLEPSTDQGQAAIDHERFYIRGAFPSTAQRMRYFERRAPELASSAVDRLLFGRRRDNISHLIVTCCTGFSAPGLDLDILERCGLSTSAERTLIGFMGCYAAINALKLARHIVRSEPLASVLVVNLELCTLHLQETSELEKILSFLLWGDGCAAALVTAEPTGFSLDGFHAVVVPGTPELITWQVRDQGFDMVLSGQVPGAIQGALALNMHEILGQTPLKEISLWAVHPGGKSVLDAVERGLGLQSSMLSASRDVLRAFGNMSSATVMFVLERLMKMAGRRAQGLAMSFGPGLVAETMRFRTG